MLSEIFTVDKLNIMTVVKCTFILDTGIAIAIRWVKIYSFSHCQILIYNWCNNNWIFIIFNKENVQAIKIKGVLSKRK